MKTVVKLGEEVGLLVQRGGRMEVLVGLDDQDQHDRLVALRPGDELRVIAIEEKEEQPVAEIL